MMSSIYCAQVRTVKLIYSTDLIFILSVLLCSIDIDSISICDIIAKGMN